MLSPALSDGAGPVRMGSRKAEMPPKSRVHGLRHLTPSHGNKPLGDALGELPALASTGVQSSRELFAGRGTSPEKLYPGES